MILASRRLRAILVLPILSYGLAILFFQAFCSSNDRASYREWALLLGVVFLALMRTRIVRRTGEWIEILSLRGRTRLLAKGYLLHFEVQKGARYGTPHWQLTCAKQPQRSVDMGLILFDGKSVIDKARRALDLPMTFETEAMFSAAEKAGGGPPRRQFVILGGLLSTAIVLVVWNVFKDDHKNGVLVLRRTSEQTWRIWGRAWQRVWKRHRAHASRQI